eukprot:GHVR01112994.1.p1 GENE.GHVR01112994.1~~GHVR01112994.1.p1  ORF type:complete len:150 (-),score=10.74 GHVR01112994.1:28-477(-)
MARLAGIIHSYTIETGIFRYRVTHDNKNNLEDKNINFMIEEYAYESLKETEKDLISQNKYFGMQLLISILDLVSKNPYSKFTAETLNTYRKEIASQLIQNEERFKLLDVKAYQKTKMIAKYIKESFQDKYNRQWSWLGADQLLAPVQWP